jgi:hypothetical protein
MILAVFESVMTVQIWLGHNNGMHLTPMGEGCGRGQVRTKRNFEEKSASFPRKPVADGAKKS